MPTAINYDPTRNTAAGFFKIVDDPEQGVAPSDRRTLLHLMFWLTYTREGRRLLADNKESAQVSEKQVEANLIDKFRTDFGIVNPALLTALVNAHLAAGRWIELNKQMPDKIQERDVQDRIYQQNMSFVMWALWEDAMAHEFSMNW